MIPNEVSTRVLQVTGGFGGVAVRTQDLAEAAGRISALASELDGFARTGLGIGRAVDMPECWFLDPSGHHHAHDAIHQAAGPIGVGGLVTTLEATVEALRAASAGYDNADRSSGELFHQLGDAGLLALLGIEAGVAGLLDRAGGHSSLRAQAGERALGVLARDDDLAETISAAIPAVLSAVTGDRHLATGAGVANALDGWLGTLGRWLDGYPWFHDGGSGQAVLSAPAVITPPVTVASVLARVPESSATRPRIGIERIDSAAGHRWIVAIPGTAGWPKQSGSNPLDGTGAIALAANQRTAAVDAVEKAMKEAGIPRDEPVMLTGHSQGGMIAAAVASDPVMAAQYDVTHLLTAGAPIGAAPIPARVQVLSIEHRDDLVVKADGVRNPDRGNWTTVSAAALGPSDEAMAAHDLSRYIQTATAIDASPDPSIAAWRRSAAGFLNGSGAEQWTAVLSRATAAT